MNHISMRTDSLRALVLNRRPEVLRARAKVEGQESGVALSRRAWIPDPSLTVQGQRYNSAQEGVSEIDAGVSFSIPWGNYRKYNAGVGEARDNLAAAQHEEERAKTEAIGVLREAMEEEDRPAVGGSGRPNREPEAVRRDVVLVDHSAVLIGPAPVVSVSP